jgi:acyl-CoA synthetase (AMP-forming)/AMP-acid ligase II
VTAGDGSLIGLVHPSEAPALISADDGWSLDFSEVLDRVDAMAGQLAAAGVSPGASVAMVMDHAPETVLAFLAVVRLNAIAMPLNRQLRAREVSAAFEDCTPSLVLLSEDEGTAATEAAEAAGVPTHAVTGGDAPRVADVGSGGIRLPNPDPEAVALLLHTSGTTSRPKAVPLRQRNLAATAACIADGYGLGEDDVSYCVMPLFHVHGLVASTLAALASGGAVAIPRRVRPSAVWIHAADHSVTWTSAVPTMLGKFPPVGNRAGQSLRFVRSCSSALSPTLWSDLEDRFRVPVVEAYGMTEAAHQIATNPLPPRQRRPGTVGLPTGTEVAILDEEWTPVAAGRTGEVAVRGSGVVEGYWDNEEANTSSFRDGWFRTGDLGHLSDGGYLTLEGRLKEQINRGGEKISPREIDEVLLTHPNVREAVAFGRPDAKLGEAVEAAVVLSESVEHSDLRAHCADALAQFKVPTRFHIVERIPTGPTGKVQRRLLAEAFGQ